MIAFDQHCSGDDNDESHDDDGHDGDYDYDDDGHDDYDDDNFNDKQAYNSGWIMALIIL